MSFHEKGKHTFTSCNYCHTPITKEAKGLGPVIPNEVAISLDNPINYNTAAAFTATDVPIDTMPNELGYPPVAI